MIRAILFDMGGTLDGDGLHWQDRFSALYRDFGVVVSRETFDAAETRANEDREIVSSDFQQMVESYVKWQLAHLGLTNAELESHVITGFMAPARKAATANAKLLAELAGRGFTLGVVSNGCGNVDKLCADFGYAPFLSLVIDSRRVGLFKPDPAIFHHAAEKLGREPDEVLMVGDSFERDIRPAKRIGMKTAWLEGPDPRECPEPSLVDLRLRTLADLRGAPILSPVFA
ncbi:MAG TPA: HAD family hydrolase [Chthoniobacterales bacterium]|nr:HAD family hydrolase [Chthoniobacterales bacterium]